MNWQTRAVIDGNAYRVSKRQSIDDGQEFIVHFAPTSSGGDIHIETPAINSPKQCDIDVWENADPGSSTNDDLFVHNMNYGVEASEETPDASVTRVTSGGLDTSVGDQTEQTRVEANREYNTPGGTANRGIWRTVPVDETISFIITDQSNGSGNVYGFDTVLYEGAP